MKRNSVFKVSVPSEGGSLIRGSASVSFPDLARDYYKYLLLPTIFENVGGYSFSPSSFSVSV